ncbi:hypothetical protein [Kitasatospora camelliae]|uniref:Uncharacterized protein n=1 Tax=Kitasatospora camelliae TaxID=3156397 RepID=A0AAU8K642_9ACTN
MSEQEDTKPQVKAPTASEVKAAQMVPARQVLALGSTATVTALVAGTAVAGPVGTLAAGVVLAGGAAAARRFTTASGKSRAPGGTPARGQGAAPVRHSKVGRADAARTHSGGAPGGRSLVDTPARKAAPKPSGKGSGVPLTGLGAKLGTKNLGTVPDQHRSLGAKAPAKPSAKAGKGGSQTPSLIDSGRQRAAEKRKADISKRLPGAREEQRTRPAKGALRRSAARSAARAVWDHVRPSLARGTAEREFRRANPAPGHNANPTPEQKRAVNAWRNGLSAARRTDRKERLADRKAKRDERRKARDSAIRAALAPLEGAVAALEKWADLPDFMPGYPKGALGQAVAVVAAAININSEGNAVNFFDMSQAAEDVYAAATAAEIEGALGVGKSLMTLPEAIKVIADAFVVIAGKCSPENAPLDQSVSDALTVAQGHLIQAASAAEEASNVFQKAHAQEIERLTNQRVNEAAWDVTRNE